MNWLEGLLYGFVSGLSDFLPISSTAHQTLLIYLFGAEGRDHICDLFVCIALLLAIYMEYRAAFLYIYRQKKSDRNYRHQSTIGVSLDARLVKHAAVPLIIGLFLYPFAYRIEQNLLLISLFLMVNGVILFLPSRMLSGNKDARSMSLLDSICIGLSGVLSIFPGISRVGTMSSVGIMRGADKQHSIKWAFLLSVPAIVFLAVFDITQIFSQGAGVRLSNIFGYLLSSVGAYLGGCISIRMMKFLTIRVGFSAFAYYSWGVALFSYILYLLV